MNVTTRSIDTPQSKIVIANLLLPSTAVSTVAGTAKTQENDGTMQRNAVLFAPCNSEASFEAIVGVILPFCKYEIPEYCE